MSAEIASMESEIFQDGEGNEVFSSDPVQSKESRPIKKAKRLTKISPRKSSEDDQLANGDGTPSPPINGHKVVPFSKNSRKSRTGFGRGLPKKGGAGGKGTWGLPGQIYEDECEEGDPNYDSESETNKIKLVTVLPPLTEEEFTEALQPILHEYLEHGDTKEVNILLKNLNLTQHKHRIPQMAVSLALERHDPKREMMSLLLSDLHGAVLTNEETSKGFEDLLDNLKDLSLDTPNAPEVLGQFIARAVADECLPRHFIEHYKGRVECQLVKSALEKAEVLLSMNSGIAKMDMVWGVGGGNRPVKYLTSQMVELLQEYLLSQDIEEASHCLKDLDVPHFHHELVYQSAVIAIEKSDEMSSELIVKLLKSLTTSNIVTPQEFEKGVLRVYRDMPDICIDVPAAYSLLERLANKLELNGMMTEKLSKELPVRGRKRFVSEGDGGKIKPRAPLL